MKKDISYFIAKRIVYHQTKYILEALASLLQFDTPTYVWEDLSIDFAVRLPAFQSNTIVMVVIDIFSKAGHFGMSTTHFTASRAVELFITMICKLHGYPGVLFRMWTPFFKHLLTKSIQAKWK